MQSRLLQVAITCVICLVFWNMLDYILDEWVFREGFSFEPYYNILLPLILGMAVELFPKKNKGISGNNAKSGKSKSKSKRK